MAGMPLGAILKNKREAAGYTQQQLANILLVTRQAVSGWERDKSEPDIAIIKQLASIYEISIDDLLSEMDTERAKETLRRAALASLILGLAVSAATLCAVIWRGAGWFSLVICSTYAVVMNLIFWFVLSGAISRRSAKGLAGFLPDVSYNKPALQRLLDHERYWLISVTTIASVPFCINAFLGLQLSYLLTILILTFHVIALFIIMNYLKNMYADTLYTQPNDMWLKQVSSQPWYTFIAALGVTLVASGIGPEFLGLVNNSTPAIAYAGLMFLACILLLAGVLSELGMPEKAAKASERYKMRIGAKVVYIVLAIVDILLVLVCL